MHFWSMAQLHNSIDSGMHLVEKLIGPLRQVVSDLWVNHLKRPVDEKPSGWDQLYRDIRTYFFSCDWNRVYDFIEFMAQYGDAIEDGNRVRFTESCNKVMEAENSAYRFVGGSLAPIIHSEEIAEIERALVTPYDAVRVQIHKALVKFSDKSAPDYRTCIKESIGAVETAVRLASGEGKGKFGKLLSGLKDRLDLHPSQVAGFQKLYGYTSDDNAGIRHGMMDKDDITSDDARYMLVSCSAFANYILRLAEKAGLPLKS